MTANAITAIPADVFKNISPDATMYDRSHSVLIRTLFLYMSIQQPSGVSHHIHCAWRLQLLALFATVRFAIKPPSLHHIFIHCSNMKACKSSCAVDPLGVTCHCALGFQLQSPPGCCLFNEDVPSDFEFISTLAVPVTCPYQLFNNASFEGNCTSASFQSSCSISCQGPIYSGSIEFRCDENAIWQQTGPPCTG